MFKNILEVLIEAAMVTCYRSNMIEDDVRIHLDSYQGTFKESKDKITQGLSSLKSRESHGQKGHLKGYSNQ